jgi:hypothetical protein
MSERYHPPCLNHENGQRPEICSELFAMSHNRDLDVTKRDRFELLSAYLDGEVSPEERRLVTLWLEQDPDTQCLYRRLLHLRQGFHALHADSQSAIDPCEAADQVIRRLNHRFRRNCMAGVTAAAVVVVGVVSGALNPFERMSFGTLSATNTEENLEIALDRPPIMIPKPATTSTAMPIDSTLPGAIDIPGANETAL